MRLLTHSRAGWRYELEQREVMLLRALVREFPLTGTTAVRITRTGGDSRAAERERLLNESLAQHRKELKQRAGKLLMVRLKEGKEGWRLSMNMDEREILLQLLNDIRVECWHALGEPESLDAFPPQAPDEDEQLHQLMHLAGYFEWKMLNLESGK